jgi:class 3 adenylate cyclase
MLTVDAEVPDGWHGEYPVKGREIEATVLFADITGFSARTADMDPTETLAFVNHFFSWVSAEALRGRPGIVDKYIGDEIMVVFSREFGSDDPFVDAVQTARFMGENDIHSFNPHIGIASGVVIVGYVGTPIKYDCSVFGAPVAVAARCSKLNPQHHTPFSAWMTFPAEEWGSRDFDQVLPPNQMRQADGTVTEDAHAWALLPAHEVEMHNLGNRPVRHIVNQMAWMPSESAEDRARFVVEGIAKAGRRWRRPGTGSGPVPTSRPGGITDNA